MTDLFEEVQGAGDITSQLGILRPAFKDWKASAAEADESSFSRLTRILAAIYAFGLDAMQEKAALRKEGKNCQITFPSDTSDKNWWNPIIKMTCGDFHAERTIERNHPTIKNKKVQVPEFVPGETLIKYAVALRALERAGVKADAVEQYVREFVYENGTVKMGRWNGVIASDRASRKSSGQTSGRNMHDVEKLKTAARALLKREAVPAEVRAVASADKAEFCMMWGFISDGVFVPGKRIPGDNYDAKAKTLAAAFATESEQQQEAPDRPEGDFEVVEDAA